MKRDREVTHQAVAFSQSWQSLRALVTAADCPQEGSFNTKQD